MIILRFIKWGDSLPHFNSMWNDDHLLPEQLALEKTNNQTGRIIYFYFWRGGALILVPEMSDHSTLN